MEVITPDALLAAGDIRAERLGRVAENLARQRDAATLAALTRKGLTLEQGLPRLSRRMQGGTEVVLLDDQPLIEFDAPRIEWSADGRTVTATVQSREV